MTKREKNRTLIGKSGTMLLHISLVLIKSAMISGQDNFLMLVFRRKAYIEGYFGCL